MTEDDLELACIAWFDDLGWDYKPGEAISPGGKTPERKRYAEVILKDRLLSALQRHNAGLPAVALEEAVGKVVHISGQSLVDTNKQLYGWLRDGIPVEVEEGGHRRGITAQVFDWVNPDNNDWLVVNQFTVKGSKTRRPDLVAFVNGVPLAVIELKNPADTNTDVWAAWNQIETYKAEIPQLFEPALCNIISDGAVARIGSLTAGQDRYMPWRVADGIDDPNQHLELEVLVRGLFAKHRLLQYLRHFVAFQTGGGGTAKIIAGYHQFHGVLKAVARAVDAVQHRHDGKGGVVWFTQGSGKSFLALFYAAMLREHPALGNPTIVVVTDRNDLDGQLYETFAGCLVPLGTRPKQAKDRADLQEMLSEQQAGGVFFTTIQKFAPATPDERVDVLCERSNVIVICDEAHRTQYGFAAKMNRRTGQIGYGLARYMRDALPNATYLGLTGTPIATDDKDTEAVFGDYVDIYDVRASQEDGTTVPIYYESRIIQLALNEAEREELDADLEELIEEADEGERSRTISRLARLESIAMADGRLQKLAADLVEHWERRLDVLDGKAMIVAMSRRAAVALYDEIIKLRPSWHDDALDKGVIKIIMTSPASDPPELRRHATTRQQKKTLEKRLKDAADPLKLVIVRDMWLTGFDAPPLNTLYVDKPMQGHNLMQAIARVNRVWKDKPGGLVVDYIGIGVELQKAIRTYTRAAGEKRGLPAEDVDTAVGVLLDALDAIRALLAGFDISGFDKPSRALQLLPGAMNHILHVDPEREDGNNRGVKRYMDLTAKASRAQALAGSDPRVVSLTDEVAFYQAVRAGLVKYTASGQRLNRTQREAAMRQIVAKGVLAEGVTDLYQELGLERPDISLLNDAFLQQISKLPERNLAAELLERLIGDEIKSRARRNVAQAGKFSDKLGEAINKYRNRGLTTAEVIEELIRLAQEIMAEQPPDDMSEDEYAFYQALVQNESAVRQMKDEALRGLAQELTEKLRKSATIDWQKRDGARARMRTLVKVLLKRYRYPPDAEAKAIERVIAQAENYADRWGEDA